MPQAHGDDHARALGDGRWLLISARSKGWDVRTLPIRGRPHPGTGVDWDGECFEVISSEAAQGGKVNYVLAAWADEHAIRRMERYDEAAEAQRAAERRDVR